MLLTNPAGSNSTSVRRQHLKQVRLAFHSALIALCLEETETTLDAQLSDWTFAAGALAHQLGAGRKSTGPQSDTMRRRRLMRRRAQLLRSSSLNS